VGGLVPVGLARLGIAGACGAGAAVAFYPALFAGRRMRVACLVALSAAILCTPLIVPAEKRLLRCVAAVWSVTLVVKLFDLHVGANRGERPSFSSFLAYLPNAFALVHRKLAEAPRLTPGQSVLRLVVFSLISLALWVVFAGTFVVDWRRAGFAAEHSTKVVIFFLALVPMAAALAAGWRLAGGCAIEFMDNPFAARTPADFWRRYNRPVHQFFDENVFLPLGGRRRPWRALIAVFFISALVHEYVFSMGVGRVQGYQTAFFMLQGLAVATTIRIKPRGMTAVAWVAATFAFNVASGVLFFGSVNGLVPFYQNLLPLWDSPPCRS
jgi:hypothetical protein